MTLAGHLYVPTDYSAGENDEKGFATYLLEDQPELPKYFAMMMKLNKIERPLLTEVPRLHKLSFGELKDALKKGVKVIDTRLKTDFAKGFIPGTINIQGNNAFATWMGWLISYEEPFMLIAEESKLDDDLTRKLMRIGMDNIMGYIEGFRIGLAVENLFQKVRLYLWMNSKIFSRQTTHKSWIFAVHQNIKRAT